MNSIIHACLFNYLRLSVLCLYVYLSEAAWFFRTAEMMSGSDLLLRIWTALKVRGAPLPVDELLG